MHSTRISIPRTSPAKATMEYEFSDESYEDEASVYNEVG